MVVEIVLGEIVERVLLEQEIVPKRLMVKVEQEDSESWMQQYRGAAIDYADDRPFYYGLGLGEEAQHPELPGLVSNTANEFYARAFFQRWRDALAGAT